MDMDSIPSVLSDGAGPVVSSIAESRDRGLEEDVLLCPEVSISASSVENSWYASSPFVRHTPD